MLAGVITTVYPQTMTPLQSRSGSSLRSQSDDPGSPPGGQTELHATCRLFVPWRPCWSTCTCRTMSTCAVLPASVLSSSTNVGAGTAGGAGVPLQRHTPAAVKDRAAANGVTTLSPASTANGPGSAPSLNGDHSAPDFGCERRVGRVKQVLCAREGLLRHQIVAAIPHRVDVSPHLWRHIVTRCVPPSHV